LLPFLDTMGADIRIVPYSNTTTTSSGPPAFRTPPPVCCFVVQDVVSEEWWNIERSSSVYKVVNLTKITAHITSWPGTTTTSYDINVRTTNASFPFTIQVGYNPISLFDNSAPHPTEVDHSNNGSALITGGVTV
jgi:hypothetical protein